MRHATVLSYEMKCNGNRDDEREEKPMRRNEAYPGAWLKSQDLQGDLTVTIKSCELEQVGQGEEAEHKPVVKFNETEKSLVLNQTNWDSIELIWGGDSDLWIGKQITLYVDPRVRFGNKVVPAIRVRPHAPASAQNHNANWTYEQAVAECSRRGITDKAMRGFLKTKGFPGYNGIACTPILQEWFTHLEPPKDVEVLFDDVPDPTDDDAPPADKDRIPF